MSMAEVNNAINTANAEAEVLALRNQISALTTALATQKDTVQCCPHCDHRSCDGSCDFRCKKVARREGCNGLQCRAPSCQRNHRVQSLVNSDFITFSDDGLVVE